MKFRNSEQKLTIQELSEFEKEFKLKLPESYKKIMLENNGGSPEKEYFQGGSVYLDNIKYGKYPLEKSIKILNDVLPKGFFPFADYIGQSLCIDLNEDGYGKIYFFDETGEIELVANSFDEFMEELSDDNDY